MRGLGRTPHVGVEVLEALGKLGDVYILDGLEATLNLGQILLVTENVSDFDVVGDGRVLLGAALMLFLF